MLAVVVGSTSLATGCLVAEAPEYGPAQQRPPVVYAEQVTPPLYRLYVFDPGAPPMPIVVPVRSEDAGDDLVGSLWVDWHMPDRKPLPVWDYPIPASSFDDDKRSWSFSYGPDDNIEPNCGHTLTLLLMHASNYDARKKVPKEDAGWDVASVTWQLNVFPEVPNVIETCTAVTVTQ
jgi:hypothetical protein